jgi:hypothetical protein
MKIFDKRAANTIPYPAKEVEKLSGTDEDPKNITSYTGFAQ